MNWYTTRERIKRGMNIDTALRDVVIDEMIESVSRTIEMMTRRFYIPRTETHLFRWPERRAGRTGDILWVDQDLLSVTTLLSEAQDASPTTIPSSDYFLEPNNPQVDGETRYDRIELDQSASASFNPGATAQRSISVLGSWGYTDRAKLVGTVASGLNSDASATQFISSNASLIGVGDTLLIDSEQLFVSGRVFVDLAKNMDDPAIADSISNSQLTAEAGHNVLAGETIRLDEEEMLVLAVVGTELTVSRAQNGTVLARHPDATDIFTTRRLTVERGVNGTTAATHADDVAISKFEPPADIVGYCVAETIARISQEGAAWGRVVGAGDGARELSGRELADLRLGIVERYQRLRMAAV